MEWAVIRKGDGDVMRICILLLAVTAFDHLGIGPPAEDFPGALFSIFFGVAIVQDIREAIRTYTYTIRRPHGYNS